MLRDVMANVTQSYIALDPRYPSLKCTRVGWARNQCWRAGSSVLGGWHWHWTHPSGHCAGGACSIHAPSNPLACAMREDRAHGRLDLLSKAVHTHAAMGFCCPVGCSLSTKRSVSNRSSQGAVLGMMGHPCMVRGRSQLACVHVCLLRRMSCYYGCTCVADVTTTMLASMHWGVSPPAACLEYTKLSLRGQVLAVAHTHTDTIGYQACFG
jgi:hypothetical protein